MNFAALFPDADYRFHMRFDRGTIASFLSPSSDYIGNIAERGRWLTSAADNHVGLLAEGVPLLNETIQFVREHTSFQSEEFETISKSDSPLLRCLQLGTVLEPDFLLLKPGASGEFHLCGGCVCFPSSWSLSSHIGRSVREIHDLVPGLNSAHGMRIDRFLANLKPGVSWERCNWGISRSPELNQHPDRNLPRLDASVELGEVWLRIEHQSFMALPDTGGVLFAIRIVVRPLREIREDPSILSAFVRALRTMPEEMARYKRISVARLRILELLLPPSRKGLAPAWSFHKLPG